MFDYERRLIPNEYVAGLDVRDGNLERTGQTIGYPAWNLLYYTLLCSIPPELPDPVVIETGTNCGLSTIIMAQALKDGGVDAKVQTVGAGPNVSEGARERVREAGLADYVDLHVGDAIEFLSGFTDHIDFVFLDDDHSGPHVIKELAIVCPLVARCGGKVYLDNTESGGVADALAWLEEHEGNLVRFANCSHHPPGNAIWQL